MKSVSVFENSDWSGSSTRGQRAEEVWDIRKSEIGTSSQIQSERRLGKELVRIKSASRSESAREKPPPTHQSQNSPRFALQDAIPTGVLPLAAVAGSVGSAL
jgi:hypothetical protein